MNRATLVPVFCFAALFAVGESSAQQKVDRKGGSSTSKLERVISGHLTDLNGKYKLQVSEITYKPGGYTGEHHHVGPGIRFVASGEVTFVQEGQTTTYKTGEYFYEAGDITNAVYNRSSSPVHIINFEIVPADWKGGSAVPPRGASSGLTQHDMGLAVWPWTTNPSIADLGGDIDADTGLPSGRD